MSATPRGKQPKKGGVITIDNDDSVERQQRAGMAVKREPEEPAQPIAELQKTVEELKAKNEKLMHIAGGYMADNEQKKERVKVLENTIDSKAGVLEGATKAQAELKNQLSRKEQHVETLLKQGSAVKDEVLDDRNRILALENEVIKEKKKNEELEKKLIDLTNQRENERKRWSEERKRDQDRIKSLTAKLEEVSSLNSQQNHSIVHQQQAELHEYDDAGDEIGNLDPMGDDLIENGAGDEINRSGDSNSEVNDAIKVGGENESIENTADTTKDSSDSVEMEKRRRSTRNMSKSVKFTDPMEESDEKGEPSVKKRRSEPVEKKQEVVPRKRKTSCKGESHSKSVKKNNDVEMQKKNALKCPECEYRSESVRAWRRHLRISHSTTPVLAGCLLRCDCGNESYSERHSRECEVSNFTIIRKGDGHIRRSDEVVTPQCVLCKMYPTTAYGYLRHLALHHKATLKANGIYLLCSCGTRYNSDYLQKHDKKCNGRDFSLHKLDED